jgi:preprotein translocase subunit Sec63
MPHELLGVSADADLSTIKRAFRTLAKEWHPDQSHDPRANTRFREIVNAYRSLVHQRTHHSPPRRPASSRAAAPSWSAAVAVESDLSWDERSPNATIAYPTRLSRFVVLGTVGFVALFWVSAFLSHL